MVDVDLSLLFDLPRFDNVRRNDCMELVGDSDKATETKLICNGVWLMASSSSSAN
jgi:hypothetical protein